MADTPDTTPRDPHRLRILHLINRSDAGGLSRYVFDLCSAMHAQGHEVAVAGARGAWHRLFENAPWPWIDLPINRGPWDLLRSVRILRKYLKDHPVDVVHSHYRRTNFVGRWARSRRTPLLYTLHLSHMHLPRPRWLFDDFGDLVHAASSDAEHWLKSAAGISPGRITVIPHGIDPDRFPQRTAADRAVARAELGYSADDRIAAYVGRFDDPKNVDWLLDLAARDHQTRFLLVGEGPHESGLRLRIENEHLQGRVSLLSSRDPLRVYQAIDALLLPSGREGFSLVCAEAMSVGVPVLRTRTSGAGELIVENVTGRSVDIDHDAFIAAAMEFLRDGEALDRMGIAAAGHIRGHFKFDHQVRRTIELYRRLSGQTAPADAETIANSPR